jgi:hypothetical protein
MDEYRMWLSADGSVLLSGNTASADFPTTPGAYQRQFAGPHAGFLTRLSSNGKRLDFSTVLNGTGRTNLYMPIEDGAGSIVVVGHTDAPDFPVTPDAVQHTYRSTFVGPPGVHGWGNAVLAIFDAHGRELRFATYLGGSGADLIRGAALGPNGEIYLVGNTYSTDFPVTPNAVQTHAAGDADAFVMKLVPTAS